MMNAVGTSQELLRQRSSRAIKVLRFSRFRKLILLLQKNQKASNRLPSKSTMQMRRKKKKLEKKKRMKMTSQLILRNKLICN